MALLTCALPFCGVGSVSAVEGGSGAYLLGSHTFMSGYIPPAGIYWGNDFLYITGSVPQLAIGGVAVSNADLNVAIYKFNSTVSFDGTVFGATPAINVNIPIAGPNIRFSGVAGIAGSLEDSEFGLGDITVTPLLGWHTGNWHYSAGLGIYLPVGKYDTASINVPDRSVDILSIGKNKFAFDPNFSLTYLNPSNGIEVSGSVGMTFNLVNSATDYLTAPEFHLEGTIAQHLPGGWIVGATGYFYQQVAEDSGAGAANFKAATGSRSLRASVLGIGPAIQFSTKVDDVGVSLTFRYLHEFEARRRFESDVVWGTVSLAF
jgi:hypothetical protein